MKSLMSAKANPITVVQKSSVRCRAALAIARELPWKSGPQGPERAQFGSGGALPQEGGILSLLGGRVLMRNG